MGSSPPHQLPIIEISDKILKPGTESWSQTCNDVVSALEEYGCFIASYDKMTQEIHDGIIQAMQELFDLPLEIKVQNKSTKPLYGYVGQIPFLPILESLGVDNANTLEGVDNFTQVLWPNGNQSFSEKLLRYTKVSAELEEIVVKMIFDKYGMGERYESHIGSVNYLCRVMKYKQPKSDESKMGLVDHTDKTFMSTIHQNGENGLEIKAKDGEWFAVHNLVSPSSIIVMAGDVIMAWSNNRIKSPHHRVVVTEPKAARYSVAQFSFVEGLVQTPQEFVDDDHPLRYKPFDHLEFLEFYNKERNRRLESAIISFCGVSH